jgi:hypothetical protein
MTFPIIYFRKQMSEKRYVFEIIKNHVFDVLYNHWNSPKCHPKLLEIAFQGPRFQTSSEGTCPEHEPCFWFSLRPSKNVALATPLHVPESMSCVQKVNFPDWMSGEFEFSLAWK